MTPIEHMNRIDEFSDQLRKLASENIVVQRFIEMYARGLIETKEKTLEMMVVALANSESNYRLELICLHARTTLPPIQDFCVVCFTGAKAHHPKCPKSREFCGPGGS